MEETNELIGALIDRAKASLIMLHEVRRRISSNDQSAYIDWGKENERIER